MKSFIFNGIDSSTLGLKVKEIPQWDVLAERRREEQTLPRFDGTLYSNEECFNSYTIDIHCMLNRNFNIESISKIKNFFKPGKGELILSHKPNNIYQVRVLNNIQFTELMLHTGEFLVTFQVEPFSYLKSGKEYVSISSNQTVVNKGNHASLPKFKVTGTGTVQIVVNGQTMRFDKVTKPFIIDCELEDVYGETGENLNNFMSIASDFTTLKEGDNKISFTGASNVQLQPNWREL